MNANRTLVWMSIAATALALVGCAPGVQPTTNRASAGPSPGRSAAEAWKPRVPPPSAEAWQLPRWERSAPYFPFLPGEDRDASRSIGDVTSGWLVNAVRIPQPHPYLAVLRVQNGRDLDYTADETLSAVAASAAYVADAFPGSTLYLGNFSADGGGDIPYSFSHNSGRDADLAFYVVDANGTQVEPPDLLPLGSDGTFTAPDGTVYTFDAARNWKLVEGLIEHSGDHIQYLFVSNPLRKMLLAEAKRVKASASVVSRAAEVLGQPGGSLPHNDHFHLRMYCSERDVRSGCENNGRRHRGFEPYRGARSDTVATAAGLLEDETADVRLAAVRRLGLLRASESSGALAGRLEDSDARVRTAAVRALADLRREERALADRLEVESDPRVRAELVWALGDFNSSDAVKALAGLLDQPSPVSLAPDFTIDLRVLVADALAVADDKRPVEPLISLTHSEDPMVRERAHRALTMLTNFDPPVTERNLGATWEKWYAKHGRRSRDQWLVMGFQAQGLAVPRLKLAHVWELCRGVLDADYLSYNAQRVLMRLSKRTPPSLEWGKADANFYWRRWFERRCKRLGCPGVPKGMSTLD